MAPPVYVWPCMEVGALFSDMHVDRPIGAGFGMSNNSLVRNPVRREQMTVKFDLDSPLSPTGHIHLEISGRPCLSISVAERDAALSMVRLVRTQYQFVSGDYSLFRIAEKRAVFNALRAALIGFKSRFDAVESCVRDARVALQEVCDAISSWLLVGYRSGEQGDVCAALCFHSGITQQGLIMAEDISHARAVVDMLFTREGAVPHEQEILDETVPMPMVVPWENSYYSLRAVYNEAVKKIGGVAGEIEVEELPDGDYLSSMRCSVDPYEFYGGPAHNAAAAKAQLCFAVIDHVHRNLGLEIHDLHYPVLKYQQRYTRHFDQKVSGLWKTGQKLMDLFGETDAFLSGLTAELGAHLSPLGGGVATAVQVFASNFRAIKARLDAAWTAFEDLKVDRETVERRIEQDLSP